MTKAKDKKEEMKKRKKMKRRKKWTAGRRHALVWPVHTPERTHHTLPTCTWRTHHLILLVERWEAAW
jgi:hypothetical protein